MQCPKCNKILDANVQTCPTCGEVLVKRRPHVREMVFCTLCGHYNKPDFLYCEKCGTKLKATNTMRGPLPLEHNEITALLVEKKNHK